MHENSDAMPDALLGVALARLKHAWLDQGVGLVSAALGLPDGAIYTATSFQSEPGKYVHAELATICLAERHSVADAIANSTMAITISPCVRASSTRVGISCVDLLKKYGIRRVHVGVIDPTQGSLTSYQEIGLDLSVTEEKPMAKACEALLKVFEKYGNRVNTDIETVNNEIGIEFLQRAAA